MPSASSRRKREDTVTGVPCPQCGHTKSKRTDAGSGSRDFKCARCGHRWSV